MENKKVTINYNFAFTKRILRKLNTNFQKFRAHCGEKKDHAYAETLYNFIIDCEHNDIFYRLLSDFECYINARIESDDDRVAFEMAVSSVF